MSAPHKYSVPSEMQNKRDNAATNNANEKKFEGILSKATSIGIEPITIITIDRTKLLL